MEANAYVLSTYIFQQTPFRETMDLLAHCDFRGIELSGTGSELLMAWEQDPRGMIEKLERAGLAVPSIHCTIAGRRSLASPDRDARQVSIA